MSAQRQEEDRRWVWRAGAVLFVLALLLRLFFWQASDDSAWPYSVAYEGDAVTWLDYAEALQESRPFEAGVPLRPPGNAYLIAAIWDGTATGITRLRLFWSTLGALTVAMLYLAVWRSFGLGAALATGLISAASSGLLLLSSSLNNEAPYLLIVAASLALWKSMSGRPAVPVLALWALLHAAGCLFRVEHVLFFALLSVYLAFLWSREAASRSRHRFAWSRSAVILGVFAFALLPWHLQAWAAVKRFNEELPDSNSATEAAQMRIERLLQGMTWQPEARRERELLPAAGRRAAANFVAATVAMRGRNTIRGEDFEILDEAFGARPRPIRAFPFVAVYGGLNFYLANHEHADGGFSRGPLDERPPLVGGQEAYPAALIAGLPPAQLALSYPPHLQALTNGYGLGWEWIGRHPGDFLVLVGKKLRIFWRGAALGLSGYNLPLGLSGLRERADLVVPEATAGTITWRLALLLLVLYGAWAWRARPGLLPWLLFLLSKIVVTLAFFGYARQGATVIPVVALLAVAGCHTLFTRLPLRVAGSPLGRRRILQLALAAGLLLLAIEGQRQLAQPQAYVDGREVESGDPFPPGEHRFRSVEYR